MAPSPAVGQVPVEDKMPGEEKMPVAYKAMVKSLATSGAFSDFTVICNGKHYHVHRAILMCHSVYFKTCFQSNFNEVKEGKVELKEDDPDAVEAMMQYFYNFDYDIVKDEDLDEECFEQELLQKHSKVYAVADKYQVPDLKTLARQKFAARLCTGERNTPFATEHVFESTPETDYGLRDICLLWYAAFVQLEKDSYTYFQVEADVSDLMKFVKSVLLRLPVVLAADLATFGLLRQAGFLMPEQMGHMKRGREALLQDLLVYLGKDGDGSRAENLRPLIHMLDHADL